MKKLNFALVIPTRNADEKIWRHVLYSISIQSQCPSQKIIIDSDSVNRTVSMADEYGFRHIPIPLSKFNHGRTRQFAINGLQDADIVIFMSQDAVPADTETFKNLLHCFDDNSIAAAYGRQLPCLYASELEQKLRNFNYPSSSRIKTIKDIPALGIHTAFCSNTFAAYRVKDLIAAGGFPETDFGEDMLVAAKLILNNKSIAYCAEAKVFHSHNYSLLDEFRRGKAIGRMHKNNPWLLDKFGKPEKTGLAFTKSCNFSCLPQFLLRGAVKYTGYLAGKY